MKNALARGQDVVSIQKGKNQGNMHLLMRIFVRTTFTVIDVIVQKSAFKCANFVGMQGVDMTKCTKAYIILTLASK